MKSSQVPAIMKEYTETWIENNPEYEYRFFDDDDMIDFVSTDFPAYLEAFKRIKYGASKADLWRYLIMYKHGGVYADMDCRCINPLRLWIDQGARYVT
ncbi:MAG: glycosyl transferase, partial [Bacteroidales bacterium]|nr:glycosyl transferase [Bacteroidales bacterium]